MSVLPPAQEPRGPRIEVALGYYSLRVTINGLVHLNCATPILGVHSWMDHDQSYSIEYTLEGDAKVTTEYTSEVIWRRVLTKVSEVIPV